MAISRMQQPQQIQSGIGSLQEPRQRYFLGKLVKKAVRNSSCNTIYTKIN
jgi:hypothetical protein